MADGVFGETMELLSGEQSQYSADDLGTGYNSVTMLCRTRRPACGWEVDVAGFSSPLGLRCRGDTCE
ncbi:hypothetical protein CPAR01_12404 [Colletotrichum paranaense]|uniref:Uncharacterized protein n=1 Tax=Colletotrichum paranaense TaxID=1914294 RepID=A0ABQ9S6B7_9PEZI|nr:uncharacterized protein CPAR01_12404 [Colletotrichum paranaense]KAK1527846.1 hypothetical protein CPAR01_12404 [Colletotrichum paranaense]